MTDITVTNGKSCFLCGIGGSGMSALARALLAQGWHVSGSDRSHDRGETPEKFARLQKDGMTLFPQDGSGVTDDISLLIVSSAVENTIPDVKAARDKKIIIKKRAEILSGLFHEAQTSIGIGGTSGKSTVTAMIGWILEYAGSNPTVMNGALMGNFGGSNIKIGGDDVFVAELDESDGSISLFNASVAVLTNISLDHKPMAELQDLFGGFVGRAQKVVIDRDHDLPDIKDTADKTNTFSLANPAAQFSASDIKPDGSGVSFKVGDVLVNLPTPGKHNVANALAAMAAVHAIGVSIEKAAESLSAFKGIKRRFERVGDKNGITVIDDFAHNPDKIAATMQTLHEQPGRVLAIFQPHGFGPTKLMKDELVKIFAAELHDDDILIMPEIYYAGGTASKDISSKDIIDAVAAQGRQARFFTQRDDIVPFLAGEAKSGDRIVIMGARDDTLPGFARDILERLA